MFLKQTFSKDLSMVPMVSMTNGTGGDENYKFISSEIKVEVEDLKKTVLDNQRVPVSVSGHYLLRYGRLYEYPSTQLKNLVDCQDMEMNCLKGRYCRKLGPKPKAVPSLLYSFEKLVTRISQSVPDNLNEINKFGGTRWNYCPNYYPQLCPMEMVKKPGTNRHRRGKRKGPPANKYSICEIKGIAYRKGKQYNKTPNVDKVMSHLVLYRILILILN